MSESLQSFALIDARERHRQQPDSFEVPSQARLERVSAGTLVKIGVTFPENDEGLDGERFWVDVLQRQGDALVGRIDNDLRCTAEHGLAQNDLIQFRLANILDVWDADA